MGESSNLKKILNFRNSNFKTCRLPTKMNNLKFKRLITLQLVYFNLHAGLFSIPCVVCFFFLKIIYLEKSSRNTVTVSNSWDPDQAQHFVGLDLSPNCLQRFSADDTSMQKELE